MKNSIALFSIFILASSFLVRGQTGKTINFLGLNPSVTVEPFYKKGELDVNILPIVFQKTLTKRVDIRVLTIFNYGVRNAGNEISHLGSQIAFPVYISKKEILLCPSQKFYLAPGFGFTRNLIEKHTNIGLWLEPGYNLMINDNWSISFAIQLGMTHFDYDNGNKKWDSHFGVKIIIGRWY